MTPPTPLSHDEVSAALSTHFNLINTKAKNHIRYKQRIAITDFEVYNLVAGVMVRMLERHKDGLLTFESAEKVIAYVLQGCKFNFRTQNVKTLSKKKKPNEDWFLEGPQMSRTDDANRKEENNMTSIDSLPESFLSITSEDTRNETDQDLTDAYYSDLYKKLFDHLNDCIDNGVFKFDEVNIYKQYILNSWTMKKLTEESDFKKSYVYNSVQKIKAHLKTVDWRTKPAE